MERLFTLLGAAVAFANSASLALAATFTRLDQGLETRNRSVDFLTASAARSMPRLAVSSVRWAAVCSSIAFLKGRHQNLSPSCRRR